MSDTQSTFLTLQQAVAEGFGAYSTLRLWISQGKLPAYKTGHRVKLKLSDLEALAKPVPVKVDPLESHIQAVVDAAPKLSAEQVARIRFALGGEAR